MTSFKKLYLTHANLNQKVHLILGSISGYHWSDRTASTHVYTPAGVFPAKETPTEIDRLIDELLTKGENNE